MERQGDVLERACLSGDGPVADERLDVPLVPVKHVEPELVRD